MAQPLEQFEGKYKILAKIGEGGMGTVYKVRHLLLDEVRVIKVMRQQDDDQEGVQERFTREARIAVKLRHPNIAQMYDFAIDEAGTAFIVMEYVDGITLQTMLKQTGVPQLGLTLELAQQSLDALSHLHKKGIVHRDISPDNLMLTRNDLDEPRIKLIDLGIAKTVAGKQNLTATGVFLGKIRYASPEQFSAQGGAPVDQRSDLYSFSVVLYELLTGVHPIKGDSFSRLIAGHLFEPPIDFDLSDPDKKIPDQLRKVVLKALEKPVGDRFPDAASFRTHILSSQKSHPWSTEALLEALAPVPIDRLVRAPQPGSTQDRIDRQFMGGAATPPPLASVATDAGKPDSTEVRPVPEGQAQADALVMAAEHLLELDLLQEAKLQLGSALNLQPNHSGALVIMAQIDEAESRAKEMAEVVSAIEGLIGEGNLEQAEHHLEAALERLAGATELEGIQEWIHQLQRERRDAELSTLLKESDTATRQGEHQRAVGILEKAEKLDPGNANTERRLESARAAVARQEQEKRRAAALATALEEAAAATQAGEHRRAVGILEKAEKLDPGNADTERRLESARADLARQEEEEHQAAVLATALIEIESLLTSERFDDARGRLEVALGEVGELDALQKIEGRIDAAETTWRETSAAVMVQRGETLLGAGKLSEAFQVFDEALRLLPEDVAASSGLARARSMLNEHRTQEAKIKAIAEVVSVVEKLIETGDLEQAEIHVKTALGPLAGASEIEAIQKRIHKLQREATLRTLLEEAAAATTRSEHRRAVETLEKAIELNPQATEAEHRLEAARAALAQQEEEEHRAAVVSATVKAVKELLASERFDDADARIALAVGEVGEIEALGDARVRVEAARTERLELEANFLFDRGEILLAEADFRQAISAFEEGLLLRPSDTAAKSSLARAQHLLKEREQLEAKDTAIAKVVNDVDRVLSQGRLDDAGKRLSKARDKFGDEERFSVLAEKLQQAVAAQELAKQVAALIRRAKSSTSSGDFPSALAALERAAELDSTQGTVQALLNETREKLREIKKKEETERRAREAVERVVEAPPSDKTRPLERTEPPDPATDRTIVLPAAQEMAAVKEKAVEEGGAVKVVAPAVPAEIEAPKPESVLPSPKEEAGPQRKTRKPLVAVAALVVVVVTVMAVLFFRTPSTPIEDSGVAVVTPGTLIVAAVPWARVTEIVDGEGVRVEIPDDAATPLRLALPPGEYIIVMVGPGPGDPIRFEAKVRAGETARLAPRLTDLDADAFLSKYGL